MGDMNGRTGRKTEDTVVGNLEKTGLMIMVKD
jgi:hypothetical protein